jgi:hypothetical protein
MNTFLMVVLALALLAGLLYLARFHHRARLEQWRDLIAPTGAHAAQDVTDECEMHQMIVDHAFGASEQARARLDISEAVRLLELALSVVEEVTPSRMKRLRIMSRLVRMSMAILPLEAVPASPFRLRRMGAVARVGELLDRLVVAPAERMAVRIRVLALGFGLTVHVMRASTKAAGRRPHAEAPWDRFRLALADWKTLDEEHLRSMRALLAAIAVELKREEIAHQPGA